MVCPFQHFSRLTKSKSQQIAILGTRDWWLSRIVISSKQEIFVIRGEGRTLFPPWVMLLS